MAVCPSRAESCCIDGRVSEPCCIDDHGRVAEPCRVNSRVAEPCCIDGRVSEPCGRISHMISGRVTEPCRVNDRVAEMCSCIDGRVAELLHQLPRDRAVSHR